MPLNFPKRKDFPYIFPNRKGGSLFFSIWEDSIIELINLEDFGIKVRVLDNILIMSRGVIWKSGNN